MGNRMRENVQQTVVTVTLSLTFTSKVIHIFPTFHKGTADASQAWLNAFVR